MSMRFSQLVTHWEPAEALAVIEILDTLREVLWQSYGEEIEQYLRDEVTASADAASKEEQQAFDFDDAIPF